MEHLQGYSRPDLDSPTLLFAFTGWADAGQSATHALRYLVECLGAHKFGSVDPEEFYDFTQTRPSSNYDEDGNRQIMWPANDFYAWHGERDYQDLIIFVGTEPSLRWRTFANQLLFVAKDLRVNKVMHVGSLLDAVPHTREPRITGSATQRGGDNGSGEKRSSRSRYNGPTGITGVIGDAIRREGIPYVSLWGHSPHYLQVSPNPKVSLSLVRAVENVLHVDVDLERLKSQGTRFDRRVARALSNEPELVEYVHRLESQYDNKLSRARSRNIQMPEPEEAVKDLEAFLKKIRDDGSG